MRIRTLQEVERSFPKITQEESRSVLGGINLLTPQGYYGPWNYEPATGYGTFSDDGNPLTIGGGYYSYVYSGSTYSGYSTGYGDTTFQFRGLDIDTGNPVYDRAGGGYVQFDSTLLTVVGTSGTVTTYFDTVTGGYYDIDYDFTPLPSTPTDIQTAISFYLDSDAFTTGGGGYLEYYDSNGVVQRTYASPFNGPTGDATFQFYSLDPSSNTITYIVQETGQTFTLSDRSNLIFGPESGVSGYQDWDSTNPGNEVVYFDALTGGYILTDLSGNLLPTP